MIDELSPGYRAALAAFVDGRGDEVQAGDLEDLCREGLLDHVDGKYVATRAGLDYFADSPAMKGDRQRADEARKKVLVRQGTRIRIKTDELPAGQRHKGQDVKVVVVLEDGTERPLNCFKSVDWYVDGRRGYSTAVLVAEGVELDVSATAPRVVEHFEAQLLRQERHVELTSRDVKIAQDETARMCDLLGVEVARRKRLEEVVEKLGMKIETGEDDEVRVTLPEPMERVVREYETGVVVAVAPAEDLQDKVGGP